jgi:precorrin-2/cobalt-factor-2 C20-methyltransferase
VAFATVGDPGVYSTFAPLARTVRRFRPGVRIETVPGITAMQDLAARSGVVLVAGAERLALVPCAGGTGDLRGILEDFDTVVCYKAGASFPQVVRAVREAGRLGGMVQGVRLGLPGGRIAWGEEVRERPAPYLTTAIVLPARDGEGWEP